MGPQLQIFRFKMYEKFHKNKKFETDYDLTNLILIPVNQLFFNSITYHDFKKAVNLKVKILMYYSFILSFHFFSQIADVTILESDVKDIYFIFKLTIVQQLQLHLSFIIFK